MSLKRQIMGNTYLIWLTDDIMGKFKFRKTDIDGMFVVEPKVFEDNRGYFMETYHENDFKKAGHDLTFVQDNQSKSSKGVLRGLHFQLKYPQGKLVRVIRGKVFDVGVDLRGDSSTYGKWHGEILSDENKKQLYIPPKFAHGFLVLSDEAEFLYKCTEFYHGEDECGIMWNDEDIAIDWPLDEIDEIILSEKDKKLKSFKQVNIKY